MAQLVVSAVSAGVGFLIGGTTGAQIGWALGGALYASSQTVKNTGPLSNDLKSPKLQYGAKIPRAYGRMRVPMNPIWLSDKRAIANTTTEGGKGGPTVENTVYTYEIDGLFEVATGSNVVGFTRLWIGGELVYSVLTDSDTSTIFSSINSERWAEIRFFSGAADQQPWAVYEAAVGVGNAVAYRHRATIGIDSLNLGGSDQVPLIEVEIVTSSTYAAQVDDFNDLSSASNPEWGTMAAASDGVKVMKALFAGGTTYDVTTTKYNFDGTTTAVASFQILNSNGTGAKLDSDVCVAAFARASSSTDIDVYNEEGVVLHQITFPEAFVGERIRGAYKSDGTLVIGQTNTTSKRLYKYTSSGIVTGPILPLYVISVTICDDAIYALSSNGAAIYKLNSTTLALDDTLTPPGASTLSAILLGTADGTLHYATTSGVWRRDGSVWTNLIGGMAPAGVDDQSNFADLVHFDGNVIYTAAVGVTATFPIYRVQLSITPGTEDLADIVTAECALGGLDASQIDVSDLVGIDVIGFAANGSPRQAIEQLMAAYYFEARCSDKLYFVRRGGAAVDSIPYEDLAAGENEASEVAFDPQRGNLEELPAQISVTYPNLNADYENGSEMADRLVGPGSRVEVVTLPVVLESADAKGRALAMVMDALAANTTASISVTDDYAALEPGDPITVEDRNGATYRMRIVREQYFALIKRLELVLDDPTALVSTGITSDLSTPAISVSPPAVTELEVLDIPLLRDADDGVGLYFAFGRRSGSWPGAALFKGLDGVTYEQQLQVTDSTVVGLTSSALPDWTGGNVFDDKSTVTVTVRYGTLSSASHANVLDAEANACVIGNELLQFKTATLISPNVYLLSGLLRGRRGTEWAQTGHAASERFVLLQDSGIRRLLLATSELSAERHYRGVTLGRALGTAADEPFTCEGVSQKPWSPVDGRGVRGAVETGSLLLHGDGSDASTTFTDSSTNALTMTAVGNAQIDTAQSKFGGASMLFDGTGDAVKTPHASVLDTPTGDFTIECWVRLASVGANQVIAVKATGSGFYPYQIAFLSAGAKFTFTGFNSINASAFSITGATTISANTWYHVAAVRDGNTFRLYVDGVQDGSASSSATLRSNASDPFAVGGYENGSASTNGHIDDFRFTKGLCWYPGGATFTVPSAAYPNPTAGQYDVVLTWTRRTRFDTNFSNGTVPLAEDSEAYEVDIFEDGTYATVARTISGLTSPSTTYTEAQQIEDFGVAQSTVYARIYQMSALVGRGYPLQRAF